MGFNRIEPTFNISSVTAILGPTNTGKTHLAIERMLAHKNGIIGLPLRLLAREVYDKICQTVGAQKVALITGEEKIKPDEACYWVATVEAMPLDISVDFLALDEVQLANDPERGHIFTDRILHARGRYETLFLGSQTMGDLLGDLISKVNFISRPRLSQLRYAGEKKITRLPGRTAIIAFSANDVYSIAELVRRQRGGAAVVLGALSPRTRNAQVSLFQNGDVDFLVATDAIGMGLNLNLNYVAFSSVRKFDGENFRNLTPSELGQIAGRAGRHINDGLFGVTASCQPFSSELVEAIETHTFDAVRVLQWRNRDLDFRSLVGLRNSLLSLPKNHRLFRARSADDLIALENLSEDTEVLSLASTEGAIKRLWEVCQLPDYRKISMQNHAELIGRLYKDLMKPEGTIDEDWFARQVKISSRTDGDIDTLSNRLAHIRTWTFVSNRNDWLKDPKYWQQKTHEIEDILSDALHNQLAQRFVDRRTSVLMKGLRDKPQLKAEVKKDGSVFIEDVFVGLLKGFLFTPDSNSDHLTSKATRTAIAQILIREFANRTEALLQESENAFHFDERGQILWRDEVIASIEAYHSPLNPGIALFADEHLSEIDRKKIISRLRGWLDVLISSKLAPLVLLSKADDITGLSKGIAYSLIENYGSLKREFFTKEIKSLDQVARSQLRKYGVRFGAYDIFFPNLLKPAAAQLLLLLWRVNYYKKNGSKNEILPTSPRAGLTSIPIDLSLPENYYRVCGYHVCGLRAVRFDILERLSNIIRPLLLWKKNDENSCKSPSGATGDGGFLITSEMISLLGCSAHEVGGILQKLGFELEPQDNKFKTINTYEKSSLSNKNLVCQNSFLIRPDFSSGTPQSVKSGSVAKPVCDENETKKSEKNVVWRPRRRFQVERQGKKNFKIQSETSVIRGKANVKRDKKNRVNDAEINNSEILKHFSKKNYSWGSAMSETFIPVASKSVENDKKGNKKKKLFSKTSETSHNSLNKSVSESNSPFAALMTIRSKLVRADRERGS
ncbi:MAG: helicase-related protein [Hyphomicrobium sp.]